MDNVRVPKKFTVTKYELECQWRTCSEKFTELFPFFKHIRWHIFENIPDYADIIECKKDSNSSLGCEWQKCGFNTNLKSEYIRHILYHGYHTKLKYVGKLLLELNEQICHMDSFCSNILPEPLERPLCNWENCDYKTEDHYSFYQHVQCHVTEGDSGIDKIYKCQWKDCKLDYKVKRTLLEHLRTHTNEKVIACPTCGSLYASKTKFLDHIKRQVTDENQKYNCQFCNKPFASEKILKMHTTEYHGTPVKCPYCPFLSPTVGNLKKHILYKHSDDKPFHCDQCPMACKSRYDLQKHYENIHSQPPGAPPIYYQCPMLMNTQEENSEKIQCEFQCKSEPILIRHIKLKHYNDVPAPSSMFPLSVTQYTESGAIFNNPVNDSYNSHSNFNNIIVMGNTNMDTQNNLNNNNNNNDIIDANNDPRQQHSITISFLGANHNPSNPAINTTTNLIQNQLTKDDNKDMNNCSIDTNNNNNNPNPHMFAISDVNSLNNNFDCNNKSENVINDSGNSLLDISINDVVNRLGFTANKAYLVRTPLQPNLNTSVNIDNNNNISNNNNNNVNDNVNVNNHNVSTTSKKRKGSASKRDKNPPNLRYLCHLCDKKYSRSDKLSNHLQRIHNFTYHNQRFRYQLYEDGNYRVKPVLIMAFETANNTQGIAPYSTVLAALPAPVNNDPTDVAVLSHAQSSAHAGHKHKDSTHSSTNAKDRSSRHHNDLNVLNLSTTVRSGSQLNYEPSPNHNNNNNGPGQMHSHDIGNIIMAPGGGALFPNYLGNFPAHLLNRQGDDSLNAQHQHFMQQGQPDPSRNLMYPGNNHPNMVQLFNLAAANNLNSNIVNIDKLNTNNNNHSADIEDNSSIIRQNLTLLSSLNPQPSSLGPAENFHGGIAGGGPPAMRNLLERQHQQLLQLNNLQNLQNQLLFASNNGGAKSLNLNLGNIENTRNNGLNNLHNVPPYGEQMQNQFNPNNSQSSFDLQHFLNSNAIGSSSLRGGHPHNNFDSLNQPSGGGAGPSTNSLMMTKYLDSPTLNHEQQNLILMSQLQQRLEGGRPPQAYEPSSGLSSGIEQFDYILSQQGNPNFGPNSQSLSNSNAFKQTHPAQHNDNHQQSSISPIRRSETPHHDGVKQALLPPFTLEGGANNDNTIKLYPNVGTALGTTSVLLSSGGSPNKLNSPIKRQGGGPTSPFDPKITSSPPSPAITISMQNTPTKHNTTILLDNNNNNNAHHHHHHPSINQQNWARNQQLNELMSNNLLPQGHREALIQQLLLQNLSAGKNANNVMIPNMNIQNDSVTLNMLNNLNNLNSINSHFHHDNNNNTQHHQSPLIHNSTNNNNNNLVNNDNHFNDGSNPLGSRQLFPLLNPVAQHEASGMDLSFGGALHSPNQPSNHHQQMLLNHVLQSIHHQQQNNAGINMLTMTDIATSAVSDNIAGQLNLSQELALNHNTAQTLPSMSSPPFTYQMLNPVRFMDS